MTRPPAFDLLVVGGGMAGMTAAYRASTEGLRVLVVEKAPRIGGSAALSAAHLWTATSLDSLRDQCPRGDADLAAVFIADFPRAVEWVRGSGVDVSEQIQVLHGRGHVFDLLGYLAAAQRSVVRAGGLVQVETTVDSLIREDGAVVGAVIRDREGPSEVRATWTLLASGGFQGDRSMVQRFIGAGSENLLLRANPYSAGDGLRLGSAAGAATRGPMDAFYGHLFAWPLPDLRVEQIALFSLTISAQGILLNQQGRRYTDESLGDHVNVQATVGQPQGRAMLLFDAALRDRWSGTPTTVAFPTVDKIDEAASIGARVATADSWPELGKQVLAWGFDGFAIPAAVDRYNAVLEGRAEPDEPPRSGNRNPLGGGPCVAMEVHCGITYTQGGLRTDTSARVLDASEAPIRGLLAAGADLGGLYAGGYAGGLAQASVFALKAVDVVLADRASSPRPPVPVPEGTQQ